MKNLPDYAVNLVSGRDPLVSEALDWLEDCFNEQIPADITDDEIMLAVDKYHTDGWSGFCVINETLVAHIPDYVMPEPIIGRRTRRRL